MFLGACVRLRLCWLTVKKNGEKRRDLLAAATLPARAARDFVDRVAEQSPARLAVVAFIIVIAVFTALLCLPAAHRDPSEFSFVNSLFVATSAVCVTGLTPVTLHEYFSDFGLVIIAAGVQIGGMGILTIASMLGMLVSKKLGVRQRLIAAQATNTFKLGQMGTLLRTVISTVLIVETIVFFGLLIGFLRRGEQLGAAAANAAFYAISTYNNAGFALHDSGMTAFADDYWIVSVVMFSAFVGSLGFPVVLIMGVMWNRPRQWDLHTKLTLTTSLILLAVGSVLIAIFEWGNEKTFAGTGFIHYAFQSVFMSLTARSLGMNTVDVSAMSDASHLALDVLMFIGGGSSSTAGGIKVTTLAVLVLAAWAEARGARDAVAFNRRIDPSAVRLAISVTIAGFVIVIGGTMAILAITHEDLDDALMDVISAFGTCGLSSGLTERAPEPALYILSLLMFLGRLGTISLAAALSQRDSLIHFRHPEERPIIG